MKAISFLIHSHVLISAAAVALTLATQVQMGLHPGFNACLSLIFFATLFDYNFHRFLKVHFTTGAFSPEKYQWAASHRQLSKFIIIAAVVGTLISAFYVEARILYLILPLAALTLLYSVSVLKIQNSRFRIHEIPAIKTLIIAFTWSSVTVFPPVLQSGIQSGFCDLLLVFTERFTFILAIAIPFDIRDMKEDSISRLKTIPVSFGETKALYISNLSLIISLIIAFVHYLFLNRVFILPAYAVSVAFTLMIINNKKIRQLPYYHHGILDGSILLHGMIVFLSFYLRT